MGAKKEYRILAAQVKLLMELPEMIWKQLDTGNINNAAQLQQLGFHLHTGLSVASGMQQGNHPDVQKWFPVINRQKVSLTSFNEIISKESTNKLKAIKLTLEVYTTFKTITIWSLLKGVFYYYFRMLVTVEVR